MLINAFKDSFKLSNRHERNAQESRCHYFCAIVSSVSVLRGLRGGKWLISSNLEMRPLRASAVLLNSASWSNTHVLCPSDFDECESGDACCAQLCINYSGGYECSCQEGFQISLDGCGCDGKFLSSHGKTDVMCNQGQELGSGCLPN